MRWTTDTPDAPGWYWIGEGAWKDRGGERTEFVCIGPISVVHVYETVHVLGCRLEVDGLDSPPTFWAGPIPEPESE